MKINKNKIALVLAGLLLIFLTKSLIFTWIEYEWIMTGAIITSIILAIMLVDICVIFINYEALQTEKMYSNNEYKQILQRINKDLKTVNAEIYKLEEQHCYTCNIEGTKNYNLHTQLMEYKKELIEERKDIERCIRNELKSKRKRD